MRKLGAITMKTTGSIVALLCGALCATANAAEVTVRNDSLDALGSAAIVWGFVPGEKAASWLTSPCNGSVRAVQIFWRSPSGGSALSVQDRIEIFRSGAFPTPGAPALTLEGPALTDGVLNEYRYLDENQTIPLVVPVNINETFVVAFTFLETQLQSIEPSLARDTNGIQPNRNAIYADLGSSFVWFNASTLGVTGDWIIRAVVDCAVGPQEADVGADLDASAPQYTAGQPLNYTIVIDNDGPVNAPNVTIVDVFPPGFASPSWSCTATGGGTCTASGNGNITQIVSLPVGGAVSYAVNGMITPAANGPLVNTVTAVVGGGVTDPVAANNIASLTLDAATVGQDFANGFE